MYSINIFLFISAFLASSAHSTEFRCSGGIIQKDDMPVIWPTSWNVNQPAPHIAGNQDCRWVFNFFQQYNPLYTKLVMSGRTGDNASHFQIIDASGTIYEVDHATAEEPWYLPFPTFQLNIHTVATAKFAFEVSLGSMSDLHEENGCAAGVKPCVIYATNQTMSTGFYAATGISVLSFPANVKNYGTLRSALVYEGSYHDRYVNSLYELHKTNGQWLSNTNGISIYNVEGSGVLDKVLVQESGYTQDIHPYHGINCAPSSTCSKTLHGEKGRSGLVYVGPQKQTILDINMDSNATLSVYYGSPNSAGFFKSYTGSTIRSQLPLTFQGNVTQYIVSSGKSMFTFKFFD